MAIKNILITGSNGLLGQKLVHKLASNPNFNLLATSLGKNRISKINKFAYSELDITSKRAVQELFLSFKPDIVINTAAKTNVDACEKDKINCDKLNVDAVKHLIQACKQHNTMLIQLSTDFVFDGENGPYKEEDKPNPLSYYGKSKLKAEELIQKSNLINWAIVRTIIIYGTAENMSRTNVVLWAKSALEKGESIRVVNDQYRAPTLAEDLADACITIAEKKACGIFHVSGKETMSILQLVRKVADYYGLNKNAVHAIKSNQLNQAAKRPPVTGFVLYKAINTLGYKPHSFDEGLQIMDEQLNN